MGMLGFLIGIAIGMFINYIVAKKFEEIAILNGYEDKHCFAMCFWLGIAGYLYVIALLISRSLIKNEQQPENPMIKPNIKKEINLSDESRYICEQIDILNEKSSGLCLMCRKNKDILKQCKIKNNIGTREIAICEDCIQLFNKNSSKN